MKTSTKNLSQAPANTLIARYLVETSTSTAFNPSHKTFFQFAGSMLNGLDKLVHPRSSKHASRFFD